MKCPFCDFEEDHVLESRATNDGRAVRRRRECLKCKNRFTSYERIEEQPILVIKRDKRRESFDRNKILEGIQKASQKRPISMETLENFVADIEKQIRDEMIKEISSIKIGKMIIEKLRNLDQVAYVRFASVYRQFKDVEEFIDEIRGRLK